MRSVDDDELKQSGTILEKFNFWRCTKAITTSMALRRTFDFTHSKTDGAVGLQYHNDRVVVHKLQVQSQIPGGDGRPVKTY